MTAVELTKGEGRRRVLADGKCQAWHWAYGCWQALNSKELRPLNQEEVVALWVSEGWEVAHG